MDLKKVLIRQLETYDDSREIYNAMDTYDMAEIVKAATNALKKLNFIKIEEHISKHPKSSADSEISRNLGNVHYKAGRHRQALIQYNKALALAPNGSNEMMLAYGNRSAVMFSIRYFTACQTDVKNCLSMKCPKGLAKKLNKRSQDTQPFVHEELFLELSTNNLFVLEFLSFDCKKNADVPCVTADVAFVSRDGTKLITAGKEIKSGSVVAIERAFATCAEVENQYVTCCHCNKMVLNPHPCKGCCQALFCDSECRDLCMKEYHQIECQIVDTVHEIYGEPVNKLMTRSAIKLSLRLGWDAFIAASKDMGASRMRTATVRQTYNSGEPLSILSYDDDKPVLEGRMFNGSIVCAVILNYLDQVPNYFPKETSKRKAAKEAMSRVMLHLYVTFTNTIPINCSSYDFYRFFHMSTVRDHAIRRIPLNGLRNVSRRIVNEHFYDITIVQPFSRRTHTRALHIFMATQHMCGCRVCLEDWDSTCEDIVSVTARQKALIDKFGNIHPNDDTEGYGVFCVMLDEFPLRSYLHKTAYQAIRVILNVVQCAKTGNKTYIVR